MAAGLSQLPQENLLCIFQKLEVRDLAAVSLVCRKLSALANDSSLWKSQLEKRYLMPPSDENDCKSFYKKNIDLIRDYDGFCITPTYELFQKVLARATLRFQMQLVGYLIHTHTEMFSDLDRESKIIDLSAKTAHRDLARWAAIYAARVLSDRSDIEEFLPCIMKSAQFDPFWLSLVYSLI